ncbi:uncharacterized protein AB675_5937 [Cyphellophora attinorum]|uniref:Uncharacterized protein n=1 Tax=Cyphellophora attinorum TaxID=1664694 RepID=A0A0N1H2K9_9EURO|nr:uncharacterized protein AB675_5937 [Phialophora attinorum]KPI38755.1 hypothetical protein AB675_5937 [Phialophora attinorum]
MYGLIWVDDKVLSENSKVLQELRDHKQLTGRPLYPEANLPVVSVIHLHFFEFFCNLRLNDKGTLTPAGGRLGAEAVTSTPLPILANAILAIMTHRPVPAARYYRLLNDSSDNLAKASLSTLTTPQAQKFLGSFLAGVFTTLTALLVLYPLVGRHLLSSHLCVSPYIQQLTFTPHPEYANLSHSYDALWEDMLPANGGFLIDKATGRSEGITMFHQLHCLQLLRIGLQRGHDDGMGRGSGHVTDGKGQNMHANDEHYLHCLDYLRQTSLCMADSTIEKTIDRKKPGRKLVDGYVTHRCSDSRRLDHEDHLPNHASRSIRRRRYRHRRNYSAAAARNNLDPSNDDDHAEGFVKESVPFVRASSAPSTPADAGKKPDRGSFSLFRSSGSGSAGKKIEIARYQSFSGKYELGGVLVADSREVQGGNDGMLIVVLTLVGLLSAKESFNRVSAQS